MANRKRGANGAGSNPKQRADGLWESKVSYTKPDGIIGRKSVYGRTSNECNQKRLDLLSDIQRGLPVRGDERLTLASYIDHWLEGRRDLSPNVAANYQSHVTKHVRPSKLGKMKLTGIQPSDIRTFITTLLDSGLTTSTVRHIMAVVSGAFKVAAMDGLVGRNPCALVKLPRPAPPKADTLTPAQVRRVWATAQEDDLYALWVLAPTLGCRQGELLALRWGNVTLSGSLPEIRIEASMKRITGKGLVRGGPKTDSANRSIPLSPVHVEVLRRHKAHQNEVRLSVGEQWVDNDLVFCTMNRVHPISFGKPLDARSVSRRWQRLLRKAGLDHIRFHALRHTAFTHMAAAEVNPETIRQLAGHSDVRVTLSIYTHPTQAMKRQAITQLGVLYEVAEREERDEGDEGDEGDEAAAVDLSANEVVNARSQLS